MVRDLVRGLCFAALAAALILQGCSNSSSRTSDRASSRPAASRAAQVDSLASGSNALHGRTASRNVTAASATRDEYQPEELPPGLAELLHAPDPNVRIQALDGWASQPSVSLEPLTYALVDSDESVRARAQELLEEALARR
jgi:outer membrane murein-binding lipoprotein Lpp